MLAPLLVTLLAAAPAPAPRTSGNVIYVVQGRAWLDAGAHDGLAQGQVLQLRHAGRPAGTCRIDQLADSRASCAGAASVGDNFALAAKAAAPAPAPVLPPPASGTELAKGRTALETAPQEQVEFNDTSGVTRRRLGPGAELRLAHTTYAASDVGPWHQERLDVFLPGAPLGRGYTLTADLSARSWSRRSETVFARPDDAAQLYVWQAAVEHRPLPGDYALALGRLRPWLAPGAGVLDGAQAGWRTRSGSEAGLFGGTLPDDSTLAPSLSRGTLGAYWSTQHQGDDSSTVRLFRHEARLAFSSTEGLGRRVEGELLGQVWVTQKLDLSADARFGVGDHQAPGALDALRIDLDARPFKTLSFTGGYRYQGLSVPERDGTSMLDLGGASHHADLSANLRLTDFLWLSAVSGFATDVVQSVSRQWVGPEVALPRVFGAAGGVSFGYLQEGGWSPGKNAWAQVTTHAPRWLRLLTRFSWFQTRGLGPLADDELGLSLSAEAELSSLIVLRITGSGRVGDTPGGRPLGAGTARAGLLDAELAGRF